MNSFFAPHGVWHITRFLFIYLALHLKARVTMRSTLLSYEFNMRALLILGEFTPGIQTCFLYSEDERQEEQSS